VSRFRIHATPLVGLKLVEREKRGDTRGFLERLFCAGELAAAGWTGPVAQINHSRTGPRGTVRGMHYQHSPAAEMKLVSCLAGEVWDVAVDIRAGSPTFLQWHAQRLSGDNNLALLVPPGFAHGFQVLGDAAELLYCHSAPYVRAAEGGLSPLDERLAIAWPLPPAGLSARDAGHPPLSADFAGLRL